MYERFCGLRVLSFCVMSNHFHILVEVPPRMDESLTDAVLLDRLSGIASDEYVAVVRMQLEKLASSTTEKGQEAYAALRMRFTHRMWDLGLFMKTLKQRFTRWYNAKNGRCGTLWEARYKSVIVESGHAARVMAAYIDLNPVRAGMVNDPKDYRWCSYAEAVVGGKRGSLARRGVSRVMEVRENQGDDDSAYDGWAHYPTPEHYEWRSVAGRYRLILFEDGVEVVSSDGRSKTRKGMRAEAMEREQERGGELSLAETLRCKTRYFVDGGVLGGKAFVSKVVEQLKGGYLKVDRVSNGSRLPEMNGRLWSMRRCVDDEG